ncbi:DUF192 domain-containing protein [Octadecabacter sp. B2R22]|nr:DUF192 domain-containing protein [Octadecabacter sp. B2R22]
MGSRHFLNLCLVSVFAVLTAGASYAECSNEHLSLRGPFGTAQFSVDVADTEDERSRGLMFVESMATMQGMLFVYDQPRSASFWMRNTLIPLDMLFADSTGTIQHIHANAQPLDETPIFGGRDIQFVLEINGGLAERLGLKEGDQMQHPSFGANSSWPCTSN